MTQSSFGPKSYFNFAYILIFDSAGGYALLKLTWINNPVNSAGESLNQKAREEIEKNMHAVQKLHDCTILNEQVALSYRCTTFFYVWEKQLHDSFLFDSTNIVIMQWYWNYNVIFQHPHDCVLRYDLVERTSMINIWERVAPRAPI